MSKPVDAVGQRIYPGDTVAHVARYGTSIHIRAREVIQIWDDGTLMLAPLSPGGQSGRTHPTNTVRISA